MCRPVRVSIVVVMVVAAVAFAVLVVLTSRHQHETTDFHRGDVHRAALQPSCGDEGEDEFGRHTDEATTRICREPRGTQVMRLPA